MSKEFDFFEELKAMEDQKAAKDELVKHAAQFEVKLKKTMTLENMIEDFKEKYAKLLADDAALDEAAEGGLSVNDLINAADEAEGKIVFEDTDPELVKTFTEAVKGIDEANARHEAEVAAEAVVEAPVVVAEEVKKPEVKVEAPKGVGKFFAAGDNRAEEIKAERAPKVFDTESICDLTGFRPTIMLIGGGRGYYTCPWWIFQWIQDNPDWKLNPHHCPHRSALDTLKSLAWFIRKDGSVKVRESRNSQFHILK